MATGVMGSTARENTTQQIQYLRRNVTFADNGKTLEVGWLRRGSLILKPLSGVQVNTAFNAGTANALDIGIQSDTDFYATQLALGAVTFVPLDENVSMQVNADTKIFVTVGLTGTAATAGSGTIVIATILNNDKGQ